MSKNSRNIVETVAKEQNDAKETAAKKKAGKRSKERASRLRAERKEKSK